MNSDTNTSGLGDLGGLDPARLLSAVLANSGDCIKILDNTGALKFLSEGGRRVMEVDDFSKLEGCFWPDLWQGEGRLNAVAAVEAAQQGRSFRFQGPADTAKGNSRHWDVSVSPIFAADGNVSHVLSISRDVTEQKLATTLLQENYDRQKFLVAELTHRAKNTLTTVMAIARQTFRNDQHREPRDLFDARLRSLSDAHSILSDTNWSTTSIRRVVESALIPYGMGTPRITVAGPDYELKPNQALTLALAVNELATNATKYGALSDSVGKVEVSWTTAPSFEFVWRERGGPLVTPPTRAGFGSRLIKNLLAQDFSGNVDLRYEPGGLICVLKA